MGLFDFVKEAGSKLGGVAHDAINEEEDTISGAADIAPERVDQLRRENIEKTFSESGFDVDSVTVAVSGSSVTLTGSVPDQVTCEKLTLAAGNQFGISQVDCQLAVENPEPQAQFYTVQAGDNLSKIAAQFYGNGGKYMKIFEANQPLLEDPDKIYPGQQLRIPGE